MYTAISINWESARNKTARLGKFIKFSKRSYGTLLRKINLIDKHVNGTFTHPMAVTATKL